ncbi:hypothetical protein C8N35_10835 [Breoghania corrubedonensis]|uniref:Flavoprotein n=1 Tax=Breoghania corrubedonensis TaxID=665038 RepID=A0A2T5V5H8_9HYPH|nr:hypothetical protein [Breoghania corrubedonensis]PTW59000.1 hypothetical protein C8N35_10835 [Breoghania corrubedonensis]
MDRARLDAALNRALLDLLSDRIVAALNARARSALVLFSDTELGLEPAVRSLATLVDAGWSFEIHRSRQARELVSLDRLDALGGAALSPFIRNAGSQNETVDAILNRHALVLMPTLSLPLAARVALGLADDDISSLVAGALERGQRIVAARDGCCPAARERIARGLTGNAAYRDMMAGHLGRLESYGVELTWAARLAATVADTPTTTLAHDPDRNQIAVPTRAPSRRVFGWSEAKVLAGTEIRLGRDVLVTPMAAEELKSRQILLVRE